MKISKQLRANIKKHKQALLDAHAEGLSAHNAGVRLGISEASVYRYSGIIGIKWYQKGGKRKAYQAQSGPHLMPTEAEAEKIALWREAGETWPVIGKRISPHSRFEPWYSMLYQNRHKLFTPQQLAVCFKGAGWHKPVTQASAKHGWLKRFLLWLDS